MQVRKFEAATLQEAIELVKRELGPDAIILQTRKHRKTLGGKSLVEVTAAISEQSLQRKVSVDRKMPAPVKEKVEKLPTPAQVRFYQAAAPLSATSDRRGSAPVDQAMAGTREQVRVSAPAKKITQVPYVDIGEGVAVAARPTPSRELPRESQDLTALRAELQQLKSAIESRTAPAEQSPWVTQALQDAFDHLVVAGLDRKTAWRLVKDVQFKLGDEESREQERVQDALAEIMLEQVPTHDVFETVVRKHEDQRDQPPALMVFMGAAGVGKTTTLAKLAAFASQHKHLKVGLINADSTRAGAFDQLATYAKLLGVPFRSVATVDDLPFALKDLQVCDAILIDTAGLSQRDQSGIDRLLQWTQALPPHHVHLVLSSTTREAELTDMGKRFSKFKPESLMFTKLDEAIVFGTLFQMPQRLKLPVSFFTTGQNVPDDLETATPERVVALVLDIH